MKAACPNSVADITKNKAYQQFGMEYINQGGSIKDIQKLYQENGGTLTPGAMSEPEDDLEDNMDNNVISNNIKSSIKDETDYPDYDDVNVFDFDDSINTAKETENNIKKSEDNIEQPITKKDYPDYDEVNTDSIDLEKEGPDFSETIEEESDL